MQFSFQYYNCKQTATASTHTKALVSHAADVNGTQSTSYWRVEYPELHKLSQWIAVCKLCLLSVHVVLVYQFYVFEHWLTKTGLAPSRCATSTELKLSVTCDTIKNRTDILCLWNICSNHNPQLLFWSLYCIGSRFARASSVLVKVCYCQCVVCPVRITHSRQRSWPACDRPNYPPSRSALCAC